MMSLRKDDRFSLVAHSIAAGMLVAALFMLKGIL